MKSLLLSLLVIPGIASAGPVSLTHSGRLVDVQGVPLSSTAQLTFVLWDAPSEGNDFHSEAIQLTPEDGYFQVRLGLGGDLLASEIPPAGLWLETKVGTISLGREPVGFVPLAAVADSVIGGSVDVSSLHVETGGSSLAHIEGDSSGYINAGVLLEANDIGANARGLGTFAYDNTGDTEWYSGRPYGDSDAWVINRQQGRGGHANSTTDVCPENFGGEGCGNALLVVDERGNVQAPQAPYFFGQGSVNTGSFANYQTYIPQVMDYNRGTLDNGDPCFNPATGVFTAPVDGVYAFQWVVLLAGVDSGGFLDPRFYVAGSTASAGSYYYGPRQIYSTGYDGTGDYYPLEGSVTLHLTQGDTFRVEVGASGSTHNVHPGNASWSYISGGLIH